MGAIPYIAILAKFTSDEVLDTAYDWLCRRRRDYPADADVWSFRQAWAREEARNFHERAVLAADVVGYGRFMGPRRWPNSPDLSPTAGKSTAEFPILVVSATIAAIFRAVREGSVYD